MIVDINKVDEVRQDIKQNIFANLNSASSMVKTIKSELPRVVANKKMNDYKLYNLNRKIENINEDVTKITSLLYKAVSRVQNAENKISKMLSSISFATVSTSLSTSSKISSWDRLLAGKDKVKQMFKDTGSEIVNWFTTKTSRIPGVFQSLKDTGAKIKNLFKKEAKSDVLNVADESFDEGIFEKTTLASVDGSRITYSKKKEEDGNINYYDKDGHLLKSILSDGSVLIYNDPGLFCDEFTKYFPDGTSILIEEGNGVDSEGRITYYDKYGKEYKRENYGSLSLDNLDSANVYSVEILEGNSWKVYKDDLLVQEKFVDSEGYINYYENGNKKTELLDDGTRNEYYENGQLKESHNIDTGNTLEYSENGTLTYQKEDGKVIFELYSDGSKKIEVVNGVYKEYTPDGVVKKEIYSDGSYRKYNNYYTKDDILYKSVDSFSGNYKLYADGDDTKYSEYRANGTLFKEVDGNSYKSYYPNGSTLYAESNGNDGHKFYTKDGLLYKTENQKSAHSYGTDTYDVK